MSVPSLISTTLPAAPPSFRLTCLLLVAVYFLARLPHLAIDPAFSDEVTYLRWAQLIRADPWHNYWVSMNDLKLPLHYWLLALFHIPGTTPVFEGRLFSVLAGAAMIPVLLSIGTELQQVLRARGDLRHFPTATFFGPLAALFMIFSPLMATYQRMALAESLLLLESVVLAWLSLRLARVIAENNARCATLRQATILGVVWGATLLTKQNFSYLLWILPPLAIVLHFRPATWRRLVLSFIPPFLLATALGLLIFLPAVATTNFDELSLRLFYKSNLSHLPMFSRSAITLINTITLLSPRAQGHPLWWPYNPEMPLDDGILYLYLTPPVFVLLIAGILWMLRRRDFIPLTFFGVWCLALLGTVIANKNWIRSRYTLLGIFPLVLLSAWIASSLAASLHPGPTFRIEKPRRIQFAAFLLLPILLLAWPLLATFAQLADFTAPTRTSMDRTEYVSGWSTAQSAQAAVQWLEQEASHHPITIITKTGLGHENDFVWLMLSSNSNIQLLCTDSLPFDPIQASNSGLTFCVEQWFPNRLATIHLDPSRPTFMLECLSLSREGVFICNPPPNKLSPQAQLVQLFINLPPTPASKPQFATAIVQLNVQPMLTSSIDPIKPSTQ